MNKMMHVLGVALLSTSMLVHARMLDVMIMNGIGEEGITTNDPSAIEFFLAYGFCAQAYPMIVSAYLVERYVYRSSDVPIADATWDIYQNKAKTLYVFIPKNYSEGINKQFNTDEFKKEASTYKAYTQQEILLGFAFSKLTKLTIEQLKKEVGDPFTQSDAKTQRIAGDKKSFVEDLQNILVSGRDDVFGLWNMVLEGHGLPKYQHPYYEFLNKEAMIADLTLRQYQQLLRFLAQKIKVNLLYNSSCFGGDNNLILPYLDVVLNEEGYVIGAQGKPNFTIVVRATTSALVGVMGPIDASRNIYVCTHGNWEKFSNLKNFFALLHKYGNERTQKAVIYNDAELQKIFINTVSPVHTFFLTGIPQIRFPGAEIFRAIAVKDTIAVLSETFVSQHIFDKKPIVLRNKDAVLIYSRDIPLQLTIEQGKDVPVPAVVSMRPGTVLHRIKKLITNVSIDKLNSFFLQVTPLDYKYYYIEQLVVQNAGSEKEVVYQDVVIATHSTTDFYSYVNMIWTALDVKGKQEIYESQYRSYYYQIGEIQKQRLVSTIDVTISGHGLLTILYNYFRAYKGLSSQKSDFEKLTELLTPEEQKQLKNQDAPDKAAALQPPPQQKSTPVVPPPLPPLPQKKDVQVDQNKLKQGMVIAKKKKKIAGQ